MKKLNKKGFTLAELLIVIAIIAILIAIAIPVFGGQLENARLQTDHANMRSAYAVAQVANIDGILYTGPEGKTPIDSFTDDDTFYFNADGSISAEGVSTNAYKLKAETTDANDCVSSAVCQTNSGKHLKNAMISIVYDSGSFSVVLTDPA